jgi:hypothetical protein
VYQPEAKTSQLVCQSRQTVGQLTKDGMMTSRDLDGIPSQRVGQIRLTVRLPLLGSQVALAPRDNEEWAAVQVIRVGDARVEIVHDNVASTIVVEHNMSDKRVVQFETVFQLGQEGISNLSLEWHTVEALVQLSAQSC